MVEIKAMTQKTTVLLKLHPGYGLGDAVQMTAVLRHLAKHRPDWQIDYVADAGRHDAAIGLVHHAWTYEEFHEKGQYQNYDREAIIHLYDTFAGWNDRPSTRVSSCLHEKFGMEWRREDGRYAINLTEQAKDKSFSFLEGVAQYGNFNAKRFQAVCVHYSGDSSPSMKNLTDNQAANICASIQEHARIPLLLDWRGKSPICSQGGIASVAHYQIDRAKWGASAQMNAAIISQCEAFIGIDSGPAKCAAATETPSLLIWTGHHPALYYDPAPNVTHLIPANWRDNPLLQGNTDVMAFFSRNYRFREYAPGEMELEAKRWLGEILK